MWAFADGGEWRQLSSCGLCGLLIAVASLVVAHGLWSTDSVVAAHRLSCPVACGVLVPQAKLLVSHVGFFVTPWTIALQAPPSMGFSRQEYWSG